MEGVAAEVTDGAEGLALVGAHDALGGVLDHLEVVAMGDVHDGIHLTGYAGVVHGDDDLGLVRNGGLDLCLVDVHGVGPDIHKHQLCARQHEGVGGAGEGVAGEDDLVARLEAAEQGGHVEGRAAAGGQQHLSCAKALLHPGVALLGKLPVAADFMRLDGLADVVEFRAHIGRYVKADHEEPSFLI